MGLDAQDRDKIIAWHDELRGEITLRLLLGEDERSRDFALFGRTLSELIPAIRLVTESTGNGELPSLTFDKGWRYRAIPAGNELGPFLELMAMRLKGAIQAPEKVRKELREVAWTARFKVYVAPRCPFCPEVVRQIQAFPMANPNIHLDIIDGMLFPELAERDRVRSVPTVILDDQFRWTGSVVLQELLDALGHRDPARMTAQELIGIIKEGNAAHLAQMMLQRRAVFPAFLELLRHPNWSERLGAMVVIEHLAEEDSELAITVCPHLLGYLQTAENPVRGDLVYLLGALGCAEADAVLRKLMVGEDSEEGREILLEALDKLAGKAVR